MCSACDSHAALEPTNRRRKIWEVQGSWGCSIVGTCVSLSELRTLARKLRLRPNPDFPIDYQLHGHFAADVAAPTRTAKLLNKLLDKKHAATIRRLAKIRCHEELERHWLDALDSGDIPGPYWVILTHPNTTPALAERMFADVHMLSHMVGASNRADIRVLRQLQEETAALGETLRKEKARAARNSEQKRREIDELQNDLQRQHLARIKAEAAVQRLRQAASRNVKAMNENNQFDEIEPIRQRSEELSAELKQASGDNAQLAVTVAALRVELASLEAALPSDASDGGDSGGKSEQCVFDLNGRCILYVGGRSSYVCRMRSLVEQWNGELLHHDGGLEKSIDELAGSVVRADAVMFPTDCVSHSAANKVKRLCRQTMKPFVPLRSSGVGSFVAGLHSAFEPSSA